MTGQSSRGPALATLRESLAPHQVVQDEHERAEPVEPDAGTSGQTSMPPEPPPSVTEPDPVLPGWPPGVPNQPVHVGDTTRLSSSFRAIADMPRSTGWRRWLRMGPSRSQIAAAQRKARLLTSFPEPLTLACMSVKGSAGKTTVMRGLTAALAKNRGGGVVFVDVNELRGTAGLRSVLTHGRHIGDVLARSDYLLGQHAQVSEVEWCMNRQPDSSEWVLVSDPTATVPMAEKEFYHLHTILKRFYSIIGFDTGNAELATSWKAVARSTDLVVVPMKWRADHIEPAAKMLAAMLGRGEQLVGRVVIVGTNNKDEADPLARKQAYEHFEGLPILEIPVDPGLNEQVIRWNNLRPVTQVAFEELGAVLLDMAQEKIRTRNGQSLR